MCTNLAKRGATYYFRRVIPHELRSAFGGKSEFMVSLRVKERETAKRLIPDWRKKTDQLLDEAQARLGSHAAPPVSARPFSEFQLEQADLVAQDEAERQARWDAREPLRQRLLAAFERSTMELSPDEAAMRDLLRDAQSDLTIEQERNLLRRVGRAEERRGIRPQGGEGMAQEAPAEAPQSPIADQARKAPGVMLDTTIVDLWAAERKVVQKGIDTHRAVARWLYDRVGRKPVDQITRKDVLTFKAKLVEEGQSAANIKMKLSRLRTLLQWASLND